MVADIDTETQQKNDYELIELDTYTKTGLKKVPIDFFDNEYLGVLKPSALSLCVDIRGFSSFLSTNDEETVFKLITLFTSNLLSCINQVGYGCSYYKLLGDGALIIWDEATEESIKEAINVFITYRDFVNEEIFCNYKNNLGFGGALVLDRVYKYEISAEASQLKYRDYVGYGINLACRLEGLANNRLILNHELVEHAKLEYETDESPEIKTALSLLKGLKDSDREKIYLLKG
ncbi:MAG: hypothetical protein IJU92_02445 [Spirochaetaceae bacterium]|nr:hypothetical protein [Spirochaetaceae bacterium]